MKFFIYMYMYIYICSVCNSALPLDVSGQSVLSHVGVTQRVPAAVRQQSGAAGGQRRKRKASEAGEPPAQPLADFLLKSCKTYTFTLYSNTCTCT